MNEETFEDELKRYQIGYDPTSKQIIWFKNETAASITLIPEDYHGVHHRNDSSKIYHHLPPHGYFRWPVFMGWKKCYVQEWHFKRVF